MDIRPVIALDEAEFAMLAGTSLMERLLLNRLRVRYKSLPDANSIFALVIPWLKDNCKGVFYVRNTKDTMPGEAVLYFSEDTDIVAFRLRFSDGFVP